MVFKSFYVNHFLINLLKYVGLEMRWCAFFIQKGDVHNKMGCNMIESVLFCVFFGGKKIEKTAVLHEEN